MGNVKLLETKTKDELKIAMGCGCKFTRNRKITIMMISFFILIAMLVKRRRMELLNGCAM